MDQVICNLYAPRLYQDEPLVQPSAYVRRITDTGTAGRFESAYSAPLTGADLLVLSAFKARPTYSLPEISAETTLRDAFRQYAWQKLRNEVVTYRKLPADWDGYGSSALSAEAVNTAIAAMEKCEQAGAEPEWMTPTTDETILIKFSLPNGSSFKLEIEDREAIGVAKWDREGHATFHDGSIANLNAILTA